MEPNIERECSALGGLFQQIIADMKNGTPLWEDLVAKATKLHTCLRATIQAIAAYLDAFQKIADAATNTRGATKEIGTALTRICLRHKAVEARMKTFTSAIMDCLVIPLQEKLEDWKKAVINLDKDHAKEYKRARAELKKRSTDTLRLQKKARKGKSGELQRRVESSLQDVTERRHVLEETEKHAVRAALIEERSRYCLLVAFLKPVVDEEVAMLSELSHLQEVVDQIQKHTADPYTLPPASEQVIADLKGAESSWTFQTPPSSPSSLGSRKSSMCSISSLNSSSSGSTKSHHSPNHHYWHRSLSQVAGSSASMTLGRHGMQPLPAGIMRLPSVSSQDSGFTSQDTLFPRPPSVPCVQISTMSEPSSNSGSNSSTPSTPYTGTTAPVTLPNTTATWPNLQETLQFERAATAIMSERPHTISSAYERGHQRPALTVYTFQAPDASHSQPASPVSGNVAAAAAAAAVAASAAAAATAATAENNNNSNSNSSTIPRTVSQSASKPQPIYARPPIPQRCSSLERPSVPTKSPTSAKTSVPCRPPTVQVAKSDPVKTITHVPPHIHLGKDPPQPMYVNMHELASLAASKAQEMIFPPPPPEAAHPAENPEKPEGAEKDGSTSESSLESSSGYGSQTIPVDDAAHNDGYPLGAMRNTLLRRGSVQGQKPPPPIRRTSSISSSARPSTLTPVGGSLENLPPPPAFLLESNTNSTESIQGAEAASEEKRTISVAETVRTLTELKHQPASPNALRRNSSIRSQSADRRGPEASPGSGLIAALSAKLAPNLSPRNSRRHSEDLNPGGSCGNRFLQKGMLGPGQGFLQTLNTKLALQQQQLQMHGPQHKAARIRQFIAARTLPDPELCHESLMDQIKRGTTLRRTGTINDRSAPKIR